MRNFTSLKSIRRESDAILKGRGWAVGSGPLEVAQEWRENLNTCTDASHCEVADCGPI
jgi:hypothetical protein